MTNAAKVIDISAWIKQKSEKINENSKITRKEKLILERRGIKSPVKKYTPPPIEKSFTYEDIPF